jgi:Tfp pilus assembly protein PilN
MAEMLEVTGRSLPNRVWFNELSFSKSESGNEVTLYGYAHNDALVAALMERLEKETETQNVRLIYSESVSSEDVYDNSSFENVNLVQFEVRMTMKSKSETK